MDWIDARKRKPEGKVFWALTRGRNECGYCDWEIIRLWNCEHGDYRTLDFSGSYRPPETYNGQSWYDTFFAWLPLDAIPIDDKAYG
jgi:hypothetical protein